MTVGRFQRVRISLRTRLAVGLCRVSSYAFLVTSGLLGTGFPPGPVPEGEFDEIYR